MFVNYNKYKDIKNCSKEQFKKYSPFKNLKDSQLKTNITWHDAYWQVFKNPKLDPNSIIACKTYIQMKRMILSI